MTPHGLTAELPLAAPMRLVLDSIGPVRLAGLASSHMGVTLLLTTTPGAAPALALIGSGELRVVVWLLVGLCVAVGFLVAAWLAKKAGL